MQNDLDHTLYFDANALWKFYVDGERGVLNIRRTVSGSSNHILLSPLTTLEFLGRLTKAYRRRDIKKRELNRLAKRLRRDIGTKADSHRPFRIVSMSSEDIRDAERILLDQGIFYNIGSNDALHIAVVQKLLATRSFVKLVTSDHSMQQVCSKLSIEFHDPEASDES